MKGGGKKQLRHTKPLVIPTVCSQHERSARTAEYTRTSPHTRLATRIQSPNGPTRTSLLLNTADILMGALGRDA